MTNKAERERERIIKSLNQDRPRYDWLTPGMVAFLSFLVLLALALMCYCH